MKICAVVLTHNEELHLERCLSSLRELATHIVIVDSYSDDRTVQIASAYGANLFSRAWINYADQFNWALSHVPPDAEWILRIDADEFITPELSDEIIKKIRNVPTSVAGISFPRHMCFQGEMIKFGGVFPVHVVRLFRKGRGRCEARWMDEHIATDGPTISFSGKLIDDNRNSLTWWTEKHNRYSSREVVDILNQAYPFMEHDSIANLTGGGQAGTKRWIKERIYAHLPPGLRAAAYFFYRYVIRLGFLDGPAGRSFHVLQAFWYRYLVDAKLQEVRRYMKSNDSDVREAIQMVLGIDVSTLHTK